MSSTLRRELQRQEFEGGTVSAFGESQGDARLITIHGVSENVDIPVREVASNQGTSQSALLVRKSGQGHRLEALSLEALSAMLYLEPTSGRGVMERVPIR